MAGAKQKVQRTMDATEEEVNAKSATAVNDVN